MGGTKKQKSSKSSTLQAAKVIAGKIMAIAGKTGTGAKKSTKYLTKGAGTIGSKTKGTKTQKSGKTLTKKVVMSESSTKQVAAKKKKVNSETIATTVSAPKKHD